MSLFKLTTNIFFIIIGVIAALLIVSVFPVTGNYKIMVVQSGSMQPRIATGSLVVTKPADNYQVGQIITFRYGRASITHRINEIKTVNNDFIYITKGDANKASDKNEVRPDDIIGRVILAIPYLGYAVDTVKKPWGFAVIVVLPALIIISDEIKKIFQEIKKIRNKKQEARIKEL